MAVASAVLALAAPASLAAPTSHAAAATATANPAPASAGCGAAHAAVTRALEALVTRHGVPGAAAEVADPVCGRWTAARGVADLGTGRPMNAEDRLRIGSVTKSFTATVVVQLAAEGRIALDAPVERYLPGLIRGNGYDGDAITVRQLLQHTSGLPDHVESLVGEPVEDWRFRHFEPRELIATALKMPHPDTAWHYATTNSVVAGLVIEQVTGRGVEAEVRRRILEPLGLRDTYWPGDGTRIRGPHSRSYFPAPAGSGQRAGAAAPLAGWLTDGTEWNTTFGGAGGALVSTPADVGRFYRALSAGTLVPQRWLAEMRSTVPADPERLWPGARYGLGLISSPLSCGGVWWGHGGTVPGGHRALGATGPGGRSVSVVLTAVPPTDPAEADFRALVDGAFCAADRTHPLEETS
ncbi:serine hydrolase domain-containing protein [Streptomyces sp. NPDC002138]|uniref:serine hydrolase domain-containing protein n=1 Tax=Streptomyces sp. NPDC002138 TaxID=3154410 RepID=UPI0033214DB6